MLFIITDKARDLRYPFLHQHPRSDCLDLCKGFHFDEDRLKHPEVYCMGTCAVIGPPQSLESDLVIQTGRVQNGKAQVS